jgi:hydroxyacyl-ACP dehydratase HTD2-like protein with hotdog domain
VTAAVANDSKPPIDAHRRLFTRGWLVLRHTLTVDDLNAELSKLQRWQIPPDRLPENHRVKVAMIKDTMATIERKRSLCFFPGGAST